MRCQQKFQGTATCYNFGPAAPSTRTRNKKGRRKACHQHPCQLNKCATDVSAVSGTHEFCPSTCASWWSLYKQKLGCCQRRGAEGAGAAASSENAHHHLQQGETTQLVVKVVQVVKVVEEAALMEEDCPNMTAIRPHHHLQRRLPVSPCLP